MKKKLTLVVSLLLVMALSIGGTLAYLTAQTDAVTNTFTIGNITISLAEKTTGDYKIVPGDTVEKDPSITVVKGSEKCYVYAFIDNALMLDNKVVATPNVAETNWSVVKAEGGKTLYRYNTVVDASSADQPVAVFTQVTYSGTDITAENIGLLNNKTIIVDAFAHQSENTTQDVADAAAIGHFWPAA